MNIAPIARSFAKLAARDAVIVSAVRTPIGIMGGDLASLTAPQLGSIAMREAVARAGIDASEVQECIFGNVLTAGSGQAPARQAVIGAGLNLDTPTTTINKVCASGLKSVMMAAAMIKAGEQECIIAGGMESMSNSPYVLPDARNGARYGHKTMIDTVINDGLWDPYNNMHMGMCAEHVAAEHGFSREDQDAFALESYRRANEAWAAGRFDKEVVPVEVPVRRGDPKIIRMDQEPGNLRVDKVAGLRPAFTKDGTVTAANASGINDGAAALIVMSYERCQALGLTPMARIVSTADAAIEPINFPVAPEPAVRRALSKAGMEISDIDFHEVNEAFSVVTLANSKLLGLDMDTVNVNGGAVAMGHPIGASGARVLTTLLHVLEQQDASLGHASICNGGGGAAAMIVERL
eukprot:TRINITY_DN2390_c0_g1_i1.p1 TRINITY_DN2390_c0_g1~~TRINITY_DN2390_c0_g1_i1.p1  ORF type:complete len:407 (-),score=145.60 TRINITY_DN2390_c0_g1_i1:119-1339(-)